MKTQNIWIKIWNRVNGFSIHKMLLPFKSLRCIIRLIPYIITKYFLKWHDEYCYEIYRLKYEIAPSFRFGGASILLYGEGRIVLGKDSYIGSYSSINSDHGCLVTIGSGCAISHNVRIYSQTYIADQDFSGTRNLRWGNVTIGDNVWIGVNVLINPGIVIGSNSIIGANTVVTRDIAPNSIVGGTHAHLIRMKSGCQ